MKFDNEKIMPRYSFFVILMTLIAIAVIVRASYIMTVKRDYWEKVSDRVKADSVKIKPTRGDILSCDGELLASSLPEFMLFVDFDAMKNSKADTLWEEKEDSICQGLNHIFPERSAEEFRRLLRKGRSENSKRCKLWNRRVNYSTYSQVKELPIFRLVSYKGGFYNEEYNARVRPNGSSAARTIGDMFGAIDTARCGIELSFDSLLRGKLGYSHRRKVRNKYLSIVDTPAINGADIITTIDVEMQDLAERALLDELRLPQVNGEMGVAILMEVKTGDVKAIVNMTKCADGEYREIMNNAISYTCEPGSVFKPASILLALDEGKTDTAEIIHTGGGVFEMHSRFMKDHNWATQGGYGDINVARSLEVSSNIGVSYIIDKNYAARPEDYIAGLRRLGIFEDLQLPIVGYKHPRVPTPRRNPKGGVEDKTQLPWMSIGYGTQIAPINTLTFYNAIANNGKMVKPRFVKAVVKDGVTIQEFPTEVVKESIVRNPESVKTMQTVLRHVVSQGLGKKAGSKNFPVSGKTGTAQVSRGKSGYKAGGPTGYWLSFAGYFGAPGEDPKYSCIVCIKKWGLPASGGGMSGVVFHNIAEGVMAKDIALEISQAKQADSAPMPYVKPGNILAADYVLRNLGIKTRADWNGSYASGNPIWGVCSNEGESVRVKRKPQYGKSLIPDVIGMGARDAVYMLESRGVKVRIVGRGKVVSQSLHPGQTFKKGAVCVLQLKVTDKDVKKSV